MKRTTSEKNHRLALNQAFDQVSCVQINRASGASEMSCWHRCVADIGAIANQLVSESPRRPTRMTQPGPFNQRSQAREANKQGAVTPSDPVVGEGCGHVRKIKCWPPSTKIWLGHFQRKGKLAIEEAQKCRRCTPASADEPSLQPTPDSMTIEPTPANPRPGTVPSADTIPTCDAGRCRCSGAP